MLNMSFLEKAKQMPLKRHKTNDLDIETALAWLKDEVAISQIAKALGRPNGNAVYPVLRKLKEAYITGKLIIK